ncbi:MAG: hypothetical protein H6Q04_2180, partial [Acidobacteria bacterium]|nr:hypothetical protein [Acidobacteriota bacterium]
MDTHEGNVDTHERGREMWKKKKRGHPQKNVDTHEG